MSKDMNLTAIRYREELERLKTEMGKFLKLSENASRTIKGRIPLKSRKQSIQLRNLLKEFRHISIEHEKYMKEKVKQNDKDFLFEMMENQGLL